MKTLFILLSNPLIIPRKPPIVYFILLSSCPTLCLLHNSQFYFISYLISFPYPSPYFLPNHLHTSYLAFPLFPSLPSTLVCLLNTYILVFFLLPSLPRQSVCRSLPYTLAQHSLHRVLLSLLRTRNPLPTACLRTNVKVALVSFPFIVYYNFVWKVVPDSGFYLMTLSE